MNAVTPLRRDSVTAKERLLASLASLSGLKDVELLVESKLASDAPLLESIGRYLLSLGGKRMRPVLTLLVGKTFGLATPKQELLDVAAGIELIHMATLLHDDIIDKSPIRRHKESAFLKFGVDSTLLTGDFLLTRAFSLCARLDAFIIDETERACIDLTEGEILEVPLHLQNHTLNSSLEIARKKTAALFRLASISATHLAKAGNEATSQMKIFGESLGIAFQILDDVLDVTAEENLLGKKSGMDLRERKPSIVNVLWLESGSELAKHLKTAPTSHEDAFADSALKELRGSRVVAEACALATDFASKAQGALTAACAAAPEFSKETVDELQTLIEYTTERME